MGLFKGERAIYWSEPWVMDTPRTATGATEISKEIKREAGGWREILTPTLAEMKPN
jgi:hypothetical protein